LRGGRHAIIASDVVTTTSGQGVWVDASPSATIKNVTIDDTAREGILVRKARQTLVADSTVTHAHGNHGIIVIASPNVTLDNCTARRNDRDGIRVRRSPHLVLRKNDASDNGDVGMRIMRSIPYASVGDVVAAGNRASANRSRDIVVTRPHCGRKRCVTTTTHPPSGNTSTTVTTSTTTTTTTLIVVVTTTSTSTTKPTPTTQPIVLPRWRLFVRVARVEGGGDADVNVPLRSGDEPLEIAIGGKALAAFRTGDQVSAVEIAALGGDTLARFEDAATDHIAAHPADYPTFDGLVTLKWAMRVPADD